MSRIVSLKRQISAISTIQKTSHALQLTSFAWISRLKNTISFAEELLNGIKIIEKQIIDFKKNTCAQGAPTNDKKSNSRLVIVLGPQRGFCGNFNKILEQTVLQYAAIHKNTHWIGIGPYAANIIQNHQLRSASTPEIHSNKRHDFKEWMQLANTIDRLLQPITANNYTTVTLLFLRAKTILTYEGNTVELTMQSPCSCAIHDSYYRFYNRANIHQILINSWHAEQAARGTAMQQAYTNAKNSLENLSREFNKLRQMMITKELLELTSGQL